MDKKNLKLSPSGVWLYRRRIPKVLKGFYQKDQVCLSLETKSLTEARIKRDAMNAEIELKIHEIKNAKPSKARFNQLFTELRSEYLKNEREARINRDESMFTYAYDPERTEVRGDETYGDAFQAVLTGEVPDEYRLTVGELADDWIKQNRGKKSDKYVDSVETYKKAFIKYLGGDEFPENVTPGTAQKFIDDLLEQGKSPGTIAHYKSKLSEVWRWGLARDKFEGVNPFINVKIEATAEQKEQEHFRNFAPEEAKVLLEATTLENLTTDTWDYPFVTHCIIRMLPFLGCRLSELATAKREQVVKEGERYLLEIWKGKTKNAKRVIPINSSIVPLLEKALNKSRGKEYLFPELKTQKDVNSLSGKVSKITKTFEKVDGYKASIHSLRGHLATALEEIGCPEDLAAVLAGHKRLSLTYDLYSKHKNTGKLWPFIDQIHTTNSLSIFC